MRFVSVSVDTHTARDNGASVQSIIVLNLDVHVVMPRTYCETLHAASVHEPQPDALHVTATFTELREDRGSGKVVTDQRGGHT